MNTRLYTSNTTLGSKVHALEQTCPTTSGHVKYVRRVSKFWRGKIGMWSNNKWNHTLWKVLSVNTTDFLKK